MDIDNEKLIKTALDYVRCGIGANYSRESFNDRMDEIYAPFAALVNNLVAENARLRAEIDAANASSKEDELKKLLEQKPVGHVSGVELFCRPVYPLYQPLLCELYQVLGALDAGDTVLDQVSAATHMRTLPHKTLLPYFAKSPRTTAQQTIDRDTIINVLLSVGNMSEGIIADAIISAIGAQQSQVLPDGYMLVRSDVIDFLNGSGELIGCCFGEKPDEESGNYWWRRFLPGVNAKSSVVQQSPAVAQGDLIKGEAYQAGLWSMRNADAMIEDGNVINGQSPAVAVPEWVLSAIKRNLCPADSCDFHGNQDPYLSGGCCKPELQKAISYLESLPLSTSPRITEQDAWEILRTCGVSGEAATDWWNESGRALLDKLNGDKNGK